MHAPRLLVVVLLALFGALAPAVQATPATSPYEAALWQRNYHGAQTHWQAMHGAERLFHQHHWLFFQALVEQTTAAQQNFWQQHEGLIEKLERYDGPLATLYRAEAHGQAGLLHVMNRDFWKALWAFKRSYGLLADAKKGAPATLEASYKLDGLFQAALSAVPKSYKWVLDLLGYSGNLQLGMQLLAQAQSAPHLGLEAQLAHFFVLKHLSGQPQQANELIAALQHAHPQSPVLAYVAGVQLIEQHQAQQAAALLKPFTQPDAWPMLWHAYGRTQLYLGHYAQAEAAFARFESRQPSALQKLDARYRRGLCAMLSGEPELARMHWQRVINGGEGSGFDADNSAKRAAAHLLAHPPTTYSLALYKARFAYDGGLFTQAEGYLRPLVQHAHLLSQDERLELYYRLGRLADAQQQPEDALRHYTAASVMPASPYARWMQAYSLLYVARLHEAAGRNTLAKQLYKKALELDDYAYQQGLEQKAEAGLARLKSSARGE